MVLWVALSQFLECSLAGKVVIGLQCAESWVEIPAVNCLLSDLGEFDL